MVLPSCIFLAFLPLKQSVQHDYGLLRSVLAVPPRKRKTECISYSPQKTGSGLKAEAIVSPTKDVDDTLPPSLTLSEKFYSRRMLSERRTLPGTN